jgi:SAM-dependent methyltransferase
MWSHGPRPLHRKTGTEKQKRFCGSRFGEPISRASLRTRSGRTPCAPRGAPCIPCRLSGTDIPLPARSLDFVFSLGVPHHVPDTQAAIAAVAEKLKTGAPFLVYLYYAFDNRPAWYRRLWALSNGVRLTVSRLPHRVRIIVSDTIAATIYWPLARFSALLTRFRAGSRSLPLSWYADKSFYLMRTDAYDRFCTRLERCFTRVQIERMLLGAGFEQIQFSESPPYWCAVGIGSQRETSI